MASPPPAAPSLKEHCNNALDKMLAHNIYGATIQLPGKKRYVEIARNSCNLPLHAIRVFRASLSNQYSHKQGQILTAHYSHVRTALISHGLRTVAPTILTHDL